MCYDISFQVTFKELIDYFPDLIVEDQLDLDFDPVVHIVGHMYSKHPIIYRNRDDDKLHLKAMEWGVIPFYVKEEKAFMKQRATMLNARSERVLDDPKSYWNKIKNRRCLIPVSGIYEHRGIKGWKNKVPYFVKMNDQPIFYIPGLYSVVELPDTNTGEMIKRWTFTMITRPANPLMKNIHNDGDNRYRMPLFLSFDLSNKWLNAELTTEEYIDILAFEMPPERMEAWPVFSIRTHKDRPDGKIKNEYYEWDKLPPLGESNPEEKVIS